jgi:hypothetical protein
VPGVVDGAGVRGGGVGEVGALGVGAAVREREALAAGEDVRGAALKDVPGAALRDGTGSSDGVGVGVTPPVAAVVGRNIR